MNWKMGEKVWLGVSLCIILIGIYLRNSYFGFDISTDDLKKFRQLKSITTGHPEVKVAPGIDVSTGPLGQGIANAVEKIQVSQTGSTKIINHSQLLIQSNSKTYNVMGTEVGE